MTIKPQTIFADLAKEMFQVQEQGRLLLEESAHAVDFFDRIDKLEGATPADARILRGLAYQLCGNAARAIECLEGVSDARMNPDFQKLCVLSNLGYANEGLVLYRTVGSPNTGMFTASVFGGVSVGAIRTIANFISQAQRMRLTNMDGLPLATLQSAARILEAAGTEDESVAQVMTIAGSVVRDYGLVHLGRMGIESSEDLGLVRLCYRLAITAGQAARLYDEFLDRLFDEDIPMPPGVLVTFEGQGDVPLEATPREETNLEFML